MKTLKESILSSTSTGKAGFAMVMNYIRKHTGKNYFNPYSTDEIEKYIIDCASVDDSGKLNIKYTSNRNIPLRIEDDQCTKLPIKLGNLGCPLILNASKLQSDEGLPDSVISYFCCNDNEIVEVNHLPYIKIPLYGSLIFEIGGKKLRRIHCDYKGDTFSGIVKLRIFVDTNMPKEELDLLMQDIETHFEFRRVLKGKYILEVRDYKTKTLYRSYKH